MEEEHATEEQRWAESRRTFAKNSDEIYAILKNGGTIGQDLPLYLARRIKG
ncbi:MAG: hypothetical protein NC307_08930 [Roseburia sp.]|nr:hypothetical protein [Roseburia sp.]